MGKAALKQPSHMTVDEFLTWDDGADTRYELVGGEAFAMTPPSPAHSLIVINLGSEIRSRLKPPCRIFAEAGVRLAERSDTYYQADLAISCTSVAAGASQILNPVVIVEVLSPSTAAHDRATKVPDYRRIPSVKEIVLISSTASGIELWRRAGDDWTVTDVIGDGAILRLASVNVEISLASIYDGVAFETENTG